MDGAVEAAGDAISGAVFARAVEPAHGEASRHGKTCRNCHTVLSGPYCGQCGQAAHLHRSIGGFVHEIAHGVFHFEGKVWRTLPMLAWRPGDLTRRYIHGERARFVSPLALFLFAVFLMFATFESVGGPVRATFNNDRRGTQAAVTEVRADLAQARTRAAALERQRAAAVVAGTPTERIDAQIADVRSDITGLTTAMTLIEGGSADGLALPGKLNVHSGSKALDDRIAAALKNPKLLIYKLQSSAYKFAWALIPLSLPFMWAMFAWRRQYRLYDHAVYVTYSLSSVILLLVAMALLAAVGVPTAWAMLLVPVHFYRQLRQAYSLRPLSAGWRTVVLLAVSLTTLILFGLLLLGLGFSS